ncbi:Endonuclease/exonuclease/phosphatase [Mycena floridula]|nr:Endonuclease/exonuclease/phosphatase [Mycena floridula]
MATRHILTEAQVALSEARKAKKASKPQAAADAGPKSYIVARPWIQLKQSSPAVPGIKIFTWNLLAQCLVRRELFPTSSCLKASQRAEMTYEELRTGADILCLQASYPEVDRLEKILPVLETSGYECHYASGQGKKHGLLIAFKTERYSILDKRVVIYDELDVGVPARRASTFRTRNIGFMVGLRSKGSDSRGLFVATSHLFWHPRYNYERARQAGILKKQVLDFRCALGFPDWPCIIAGDFNFAPDDPAYSLMLGDPLLPEQKVVLEESRVIHRSIDATVPVSVASAAEDDESEDPDRTITNARRAKPSDELLSDPELGQLFDSSTPVRSAYSSALEQHRNNRASVQTFGSRAIIPESRKGGNEPEWTSYAHFWKTVLDYIFIVDAPNHKMAVTGFVPPHQTSDLLPALPKTGVCASDHVSLSVELEEIDTVH